MGNAIGKGKDSNGKGKEVAARVRRHAPPAVVDSRQSRSPLLFSSQGPTIPLLQNGSILLRQNDSQGSAAQPLEDGIPIIITWSFGGDSVSVGGSWDNWSERKMLQKAGEDHSLLLVLPTGIYHYNFCVDGEMRHIPHLPNEADEKGCISNVLEVTDFVPENLDSVSEFGAPSSPDSSYDQSFLDDEDEDFDEDPLGIPPQLQSTVLDHANCKKTSKPKHVVLNHLLVNKAFTSQSVVALAATNRFQSKYVTVVLFKPIKR